MPHQIKILGTSAPDNSFLLDLSAVSTGLGCHTAGCATPCLQYPRSMLTSIGQAGAEARKRVYDEVRSNPDVPRLVMEALLAHYQATSHVFFSTNLVSYNVAPGRAGGSSFIYYTHEIMDIIEDFCKADPAKYGTCVRVEGHVNMGTPSMSKYTSSMIWVPGSTKAADPSLRPARYTATSKNTSERQAAA